MIDKILGHIGAHIDSYLTGFILPLALWLIYRKLTKGTHSSDQVLDLIEAQKKRGEEPKIPETEYTQLTEKIAELEKEKETAETKLQKTSLHLGQEAAKIALEGRIEVAKEKFELALETFPEPDVTNLFGIYLLRTGDLENSIRQFEQLLEIGKRNSNKEDIAVASGNLGIIYQTKHHIDKAVGFYTKALSIYEELDHKQGMANVFGNYGALYYSSGELKKAIELQNKALILNKDLGRKEGIADTYGNLGLIYDKKEDRDKAVEFYNKALYIFKDIKDIEGVTKTYANLGNSHRTKGNLDKAVNFYNKALAIDEKIGRKEGRANNKRNIGLLKAQQGKFGEAIELMNESQELYRQVGIQYRVEETDRIIAEWEKKIGE